MPVQNLTFAQVTPDPALLATAWDRETEFRGWGAQTEFGRQGVADQDSALSTQHLALRIATARHFEVWRAARSA
jgi:hypothetical protein